MVELEREMQAYQALAKLLQDANACRDLFEAAQLDIPSPLQRLLASAPAADNKARPAALRIPPPRWPSPPEGAGPGWIAIPATEATAGCLALATLRDGPKRPTDIVNAVQQFLPDTLRGTIFNMGPRLTGRVIKKTSDGWLLLSPESAPVLRDGTLWGPKDTFGKYEIAAHRREAILHLLALHKDGLQIMQLVSLLRDCTWLVAPVTKDLVKADMQALDDKGRAKRVGASKKWRLIERTET